MMPTLLLTKEQNDAILAANATERAKMTPIPFRRVKPVFPPEIQTDPPQMQEGVHFPPEMRIEPRKLEDGSFILNADVLDDPFFSAAEKPWSKTIAAATPVELTEADLTAPEI